MGEVALISIFLIIGFFKGSLIDSLKISFYYTVCSLVQHFGLIQYQYCAVLIVILSISVKYMGSPIIKSSQYIWLLYFFIMFYFSVHHEVYRTVISKDIILTMHEWHKLIYLCTILIVIAGLAKGSGGGKRSNNNNQHYVRDRLYANNRRS